MNLAGSYLEPKALEFIKDSLLGRLGDGEGKWKQAPVYYDGAVIQACDCGQRVSLVFHSLEFVDDQCLHGCIGINRIEDGAPATWMPSGFATVPS